MIKAYLTYPGESPLDAGCLLVHHETAGKAKKMALNVFFGMDNEFTDMHAIRRPNFDRWRNKDTPHCIETNEELPDGAPKFYVELD